MPVRSCNCTLLASRTTTKRNHFFLHQCLRSGAITTYPHHSPADLRSNADNAADSRLVICRLHGILPQREGTNPKTVSPETPRSPSAASSSGVSRKSAPMPASLRGGRVAATRLVRSRYDVTERHGSCPMCSPEIGRLKDSVELFNVAGTASNNCRSVAELSSLITELHLPLI